MESVGVLSEGRLKVFALASSSVSITVASGLINKEGFSVIRIRGIFLVTSFPLIFSERKEFITKRPDTLVVPHVGRH
jgi:hypothetical protein